MKRILYITTSFFASILFSCSTQYPKNNNNPNPKKSEQKTVQTKDNTIKVEVDTKKNSIVLLPEIPREFRAAWVATVANINWPSKNNLTPEQQKSEAIALLDILEKNHFNAVIFQARPSSDALYDSKIEPWSHFLTGSTGKPPFPLYDPLEFWIEEAHKRGMELHVWLNPFRAHHSGGTPNKNSIVNIHPEMVVKLKNGMYWLDPANKNTQNHVSKVINDLVKRYELDAIHLDDYFYPYAEYNKGADFPDNKSWNEYLTNNGKLSKSDWRRDIVNHFVERIYQEIHQEKNHVRLGISPFGIWKPGFPEGIEGSSQYDELYADAKLWLNKGWVDYFAPQLYWPINSKGQNFEALLRWWQAENTKKRHLWPGLNTVAIKAPNKTEEIKNQIELSRLILGKDSGHIHWSTQGLIKNSSMLPTLKKQVYLQKALPPATHWLKTATLEKPSISYTTAQNSYTISWNYPKMNVIANAALFLRYGEEWEIKIISKYDKSITIPSIKNGKNLEYIAVRVIDLLKNESPYNAIKVKE